MKNRVNRLYIKTTHLFAAQALTSIKKEYPIHFIAISTDYVCIPFLEETNPDYFIIPHKDLESDFLKKGINKNYYPLEFLCQKVSDKSSRTKKLKEEVHSVMKKS